MFASLLDPERGGVCRIGPAGRQAESFQAYDDVTNVLQTLFRVGDGAAVVTDFMPWSEERHSSTREIHRLLEVRHGTMEMEIVFDPRFDYARGRTQVHVAEHGAVAEGPNGERVGARIERRRIVARRTGGQR